MIVEMEVNVKKRKQMQGTKARKAVWAHNRSAASRRSCLERQWGKRNRRCCVGTRTEVGAPTGAYASQRS